MLLFVGPPWVRLISTRVPCNNHPCTVGSATHVPWHNLGKTTLLPCAMGVARLRPRRAADPPRSRESDAADARTPLDSEERIDTGCHNRLGE